MMGKTNKKIHKDYDNTYLDLSKLNFEILMLRFYGENDKLDKIYCERMKIQKY